LPLCQASILEAHPEDKKQGRNENQHLENAVQQQMREATQALSEQQL